MKKRSFSSVFWAVCGLLPVWVSGGQVLWAQPQSPSIWRFGPPPLANLRLADLDGDGDPDLLYATLPDSTPICWIDDDDDMRPTDLQGDTDNDCLLLDRDRDGRWDGPHDLAVDWVDENEDGKPDLQVLVENGKEGAKGWESGHFMVTMDTDHDGVFHHFDWQSLSLEAWAHEGRSRFYQDYSGKSAFLKIHADPAHINDLRLNWENPFLFQDPDGDGLSEMAIRLMDVPTIDTTQLFSVRLTGHITDSRLAFDLDNDNASGNEFDFDLSLRFSGEGFPYGQYVQPFRHLRGLPASDSLFADPRWRQLTELVFVPDKDAYRAVVQDGKWQSAWLVFDEDDDCERWERVEFYEPRDLFRIGDRNGGLDHNPQADAIGDRGEWDGDFSGKGNLYISPMDGKIHLFGAEWGAWRIDQEGRYFQGWQGWRQTPPSWPVSQPTQPLPAMFPTIRYADTDGNGFFDQLELDLDADRQFERTVRLAELGLSDVAAIEQVASMNYRDYRQLFRRSARAQQHKARHLLKLARRVGLPTQWYAFFQQPQSWHERYHHGYWLALFLYHDLAQWGLIQRDVVWRQQLDRAYFGLGRDRDFQRLGLSKR